MTIQVSGDFGPAPPGTDLSQNQDASIYSSVIIMMILAVASVGIRIYARTMSGPGLAADDYTIFAALIISIGTAILCILCVGAGGGRHIWVLTSAQLDRFNKITYAFVLVFATAVTVTKVSILFFYKRIFGVNWAYYSAMALVVGWEVAICLTFLAGTRPVSFFWEVYTNPDAKGFSIDLASFYFINGICASVIDVFVLLVPIPTFLGLKMSTSKKLSVYGILLLGAFVCFAGIFRIYTIKKLTQTKDISFAMAHVLQWSCIEPMTGIICACLPTFAPLVKRWRQRNGYSGSGSRSGATGAGGITGSSSHHHGKASRFGNTSKIRGTRTNLTDDEVQLTNVSDRHLQRKDSDDTITYNTAQDIIVKKQFSVTTDQPYRGQGV